MMYRPRFSSLLSFGILLATLSANANANLILGVDRGSGFAIEQGPLTVSKTIAQESRVAGEFDLSGLDLASLIKVEIVIDGLVLSTTNLEAFIYEGDGLATPFDFTDGGFAGRVLFDEPAGTQVTKTLDVTPNALQLLNGGQTTLGINMREARIASSVTLEYLVLATFEDSPPVEVQSQPLDNPVPEPSSIVLLGIGAVSLAGYRSRRR